jgi:peptidoglycan/LPS O-acetylase OafA/YrhL
MTTHASKNRVGELQVRYRSLDSWRGICALLVVVYHAAGSDGIGRSAFVRGSFLLVDFFFVLSGFVMSAAYGDRIQDARQFRAFILRRTGRVWPLHAFMLIAFLGLEVAKLGVVLIARAQLTHEPFTTTMAPSGFLASLMLVHAMGVLPGLTWNIPSWSIAAEFWVYGVFAASVWGLGSRTLYFAVVVAVGAAGFLAATSTHLMDATYDLGFLRCLYGFFVGVTLFHAHRRLLRPSLLYGTRAEVISVAVACVFVAFAHDSMLAYAAPLVFACVILIYANSTGAGSKLLQSRPLVLLGTLSYSVYMTHVFLLSVLNIFSKLVAKLGLGQQLNWSTPESSAGGAGSVSLLLGFIGLVLVVSHFTYRYVEVPCQRFFSRRASRLAENRPGKATPVTE